MRPTLQDGDRITVVPAPPERLRRGDVVYCHDGRQGIVHRLRAARRAGQGWELQTQGDHHSEPDRPAAVAVMVILGRVTAAARDGRPLRIDDWWQRQWYTSPLHQCYLAVRRQGNRQVLYRLQGLSLYASLARVWGRGMAATLHERRCQRNDGTAIQLQWRRRTIAEVIYYPQTQTLASLWVRWPYRRLGLARRLVEAVIGVAQAQGAPRVQLSLRAGNWPARRLYEQLGFQVVGNAGPADDPGLLLERRLRLDPVGEKAV